MKESVPFPSPGELCWGGMKLLKDPEAFPGIAGISPSSGAAVPGRAVLVRMTCAHRPQRWRETQTPLQVILSSVEGKVAWFGF